MIRSLGEKYAKVVASDLPATDERIYPQRFLKENPLFFILNK